MLRIRFHGRGGQGVKVASRVLGTAAFSQGCYAQDFPLYGAERRGAPMTSYTRISGEPIMERGVISETDVVIVMDETLLHDPMVMPTSGLKKGGIVFINTSHSQEEAKTEYEITARLITLDLTKIGLEMLGRPILSALAGAVASKIAGLSEDSLKHAVKKEISGIITDRELIEKNIEASLYCYNAIPPVRIKTSGIKEARTVITMPFETAGISSPAIYATGNTPLRRTGNWRLFRPVWNYDACTGCMMCVARCPEGCISVNEEGFPYTDYENCKGCLICVEECPTKAVKGVPEVHA